MTQRYNNPNRNAPPPNREATPVPPDFIRDDNMTNLVKIADQLGTLLCDSRVEMNQLRNFYEAVVRLGIELDEKERREIKASPTHATRPATTDDLQLKDRAKLLPTKLVWAAAKLERYEQRQALGEFLRYVEAAVASMFENNELSFRYYDRFHQFVEAVVIYHKARKERIFQ